jgi:hypothetical protein
VNLYGYASVAPDQTLRCGMRTRVCVPWTLRAWADIIIFSTLLYHASYESGGANPAGANINSQGWLSSEASSTAAAHTHGALRGRKQGGRLRHGG